MWEGSEQFVKGKGIKTNDALCSMLGLQRHNPGIPNICGESDCIKEGTPYDCIRSRDKNLEYTRPRSLKLLVRKPDRHCCGTASQSAVIPQLPALGCLLSFMSPLLNVISDQPVCFPFLLVRFVVF